jgi:hypothetical protein
MDEMHETKMFAVYNCVSAIVKSLELQPEGVYKAGGLDSYFTRLEKGLLEEYLSDNYTCPFCGVKTGVPPVGGRECPV